jgi:hypothetical protein
MRHNSADPADGRDGAGPSAEVPKDVPNRWR